MRFHPSTHPHLHALLEQAAARASEDPSALFLAVIMLSERLAASALRDMPPLDPLLEPLVLTLAAGALRAVSLQGAEQSRCQEALGEMQSLADEIVPHAVRLAKARLAMETSPLAEAYKDKN